MEVIQLEQKLMPIVRCWLVGGNNGQAGCLLAYNVEIYIMICDDYIIPNTFISDFILIFVTKVSGLHIHVDLQFQLWRVGCGRRCLVFLPAYQTLFK